MLFFFRARSVSASSSGLSSTSRIAELISMLLPRQSEVERRAAIDLRLGPDAAAVTADDALHGHEADTRTVELLRRVQPLKDAEELRREGHVESGAVVANEVRRLLGTGIDGPELDLWIGTSARELQRVAHEV